MKKITSYKLERARLQDVPDLVRLLGAHVPSVSSDTVWHVPWTWHHYRVIRCNGEIVAAGSLQPISDRRAEIRGIVVARSHRGAGLAKSLVQHLTDAAEAHGIEAVCVTRKPGLFRKLGFEETSPSWLDLQRRPTIARASSARITMALTQRSAA